MSGVDASLLRPGTKVIYHAKKDGPGYLCTVRDWPQMLHDENRWIVQLHECKGVVLTSHISEVLA